MGGTGNDTIYGQDGNDTYVGGAGAELFIFTELNNTETDTITDFQVGVDLIDFGLTNVDSMTEFDRFYDTTYQGQQMTVIKVDNRKTLLHNVAPSELDASGFIF